MPEHGRRLDHAGMIAPAIHLDVRAARQRRPDAYAYLAIDGERPLDSHVLFAMQHGSQHGLLHYDAYTLTIRSVPS